MNTFFSKGWDGQPFSLFESAHLVILLAIVVINLWMLRFRNAPEFNPKSCSLDIGHRHLGQ